MTGTPIPPRSQDLAQVRGVMLDIDGCLVLADAPGAHSDALLLPGAAELVAYLRASGRPLVVFTNGSGRLPEQIAASLRGLGVEVADDEVLTPAVVAADVVGRRYPGRPVLAFGSGMVEVLRAHGVPFASPDEPGSAAAVVIGWDTEFVSAKVQAAAEAVLAGADLLVASDARRFASRSRRMVGISGFIAAGLRYLTGATYEVLGKPSPMAMEVITRRVGLPAEQLLVVGDDLTLEARMARSSGALGALVTTGICTAEDARSAPDEDRPDLVLDGLADLLDRWRAADARAAAGTEGVA